MTAKVDVSTGTGCYKHIMLFFLLVLLSWGAPPGQLPPSQKLSAADARDFTQELNRVRRLLATANDKGSVEFQIARTYAAGGQYREAMDWLKKVMDANLGFDPSRDKLFDPLQHASEFQALLDQVRIQTPPRSHSRPAAVIQESDVFPENLAYDAESKMMFLGSTFKHEIVRCSEQRRTCEQFVTAHKSDPGYVLGLKIHQPSRTLWATSNTDAGASLHQYALASGELLGTYAISGAHLFNDLAISSSGEVFVTDTKEGAVYRIATEDKRLERVLPDHAFTAANGIALSANEKTLYVGNFGDGITAVDLTSRSATPVLHPANVCLGYIDGLYAIEGSLIAIQNGPMVPRIVRFDLSADGRAIVDMRILERRNPAFDGITTGTITGSKFLYVANPQLDKIVNGKIASGASLAPLRVLSIELGQK
ncbi:MAG: SMP-30/gluconolactonase/LRE family protein [Acidobacteriaceae bacterium]|nr:SMP-30/gluconolactonase/LRE family protein [Acidobacteriaceae bacterium]